MWNKIFNVARTFFPSFLKGRTNLYFIPHTAYQQMVVILFFLIYPLQILQLETVYLKGSKYSDFYYTNNQYFLSDSSVPEGSALNMMVDLICFYGRRPVSTDRLLCYKFTTLHYIQANDGWKLAFIMESIKPPCLCFLLFPFKQMCILLSFLSASPQRKCTLCWLDITW
jgi:hypothetical protein